MNFLVRLTCSVSIGMTLLFSQCGYFQEDKSGLVWLHLEPGLSMGIYSDTKVAGKEEESVYIIKLEPEFFEVNLFCASQFSQKSRTLQGWAEEFELIAVINAGMYATDLSTSIGYLKSVDHLNNPVINSAYKCIFACQPQDSSIPAARIIDLTCTDFQPYQDQYSSFLQSIRMISCEQQNVWEPQDDEWSIAALGMDQENQLLFIYSFTPRTVHEFINLLLSLPLDIQCAMYLEGGIQAGLYLAAAGIKKNLPWDKRPEIRLNDESAIERPVPNVIGVRRKPYSR